MVGSSLGCTRTLVLAAAASCVVVTGCKSDGNGGDRFSAGDSTSSASDGGETASDGGTRLDVGGGDTAGDDGGLTCPGVPGDATLKGTVYAPNGALPISGAVVWLTDVPPEPIPSSVYCDACIEFECGVDHFAETDADGSFSLIADPGMQYLVVRKGGFMRVTQLDVASGDTDVDVALTTLPDHHEPTAGQYIPRIAVAVGDHDRIENALAKLGLGETMVSNYDEDIVPGTAQFDTWDNAENPPSGTLGTFDQLVSTPALLSQYHVLFVPCSMQAGEYPAILDDPQVQTNLRDWVEAGGKLYVSDWSGEAIDKPFAQYQTFWRRQDSTTVPQWAGDDTLDLGRYDPAAKVVDPDLLAWLQALPPELKDVNPLNDPSGDPLPTLDKLPDMDVIYVYSGIASVHPVLVDDGMGGQVDVGHHVWIETEGSTTWGVPTPGQMHPAAVTGEYGCGRIMFTNYHTAERAYVGLTPQELVLAYLILEIGVCQIPYEPPPPAG